MTESLGSYLRRERELRKIPLSEVADQTRVKIDYLQAIESEHFEKLPGMTFARGYLKAYASYVGLNPEDVLLRFEDLLKGMTAWDKPDVRPKGGKLGWLLLLLVVFGAGTVLALWLQK